jgi:HAE1 family hydrophobic/amphiphilic exporter-1
MGIIRFAINNPVKVAVAVLLVVLFGFLSVFAIPIQLTPNVDSPTVSIETEWRGASVQEIEREIIDRQEAVLKSVSNLREMTSRAREGRAGIELEFWVGTDRDAAVQDVSEKLRQVTGYPDEAEEPAVFASDSSEESPIAWLKLIADEDVDVNTLRHFVKEKVLPELERAEGVSRSDVYGGRDREVQIRLDAAKLAARNLTFRDVETALRRENENISAGTIAQGRRDYTFRTVGRYEDVRQIEDTIIAYQGGGPIHVRDVAVVKNTYKKPYSFGRSRGKPSLALPVHRQTGTNVITVMESLKEKIKHVNENVLAPKKMGLHLYQTYDETTYIKSAIGLVRNNIILGGTLAIIVLLLFLRSLSGTAVVALCIPISVVGTFLVITLLGRSLNVVMLAGMAFAVGMVVDNAIVVLENIYRHRQMGKDRYHAALDGATEVWGAVLASTLTTMAVFLPVLFVREEAGQLFRDIAIAISAAVALSLIISMSVIPTMSARILGGRDDDTPKTEPNDPEKTGGRLADLLARFIYRINGSVAMRLAIIGGLTGGSLFASWWMAPPSAYLPSGNRNFVFGFLDTAPGYSIDEFQRIAALIEKDIHPYWEAQFDEELAAKLPTVKVPIGEEPIGPGMHEDDREMVDVQPAPFDDFFYVSFAGGAFMGGRSADSANVLPMAKVLENATKGIPGVDARVEQRSIFARRGGSSSIQIYIRGDELNDVVQVTKAVSAECNAMFGYCRSRPSNYDVGRPEIRAVPDRVKAADLGLSVSDVGFIVEVGVDGAKVGDFRDAGEEIDMTLLVDGPASRETRAVANLSIYTPSGKTVLLSSVVNFEPTSAMQEILHIEEMPGISLSVSPPETMPLETAMTMIEDQILKPLRAEGVIPSNVITSLAGNADKLVQTKNAMLGEWTGWNLSSFTNLLKSRMFLAILVTYLLMSALFESFSYPFIIMFSVPLATVGGFMGLSIVHAQTLRDPLTPVQQLDVLTMLGFVILIGIVVNNAILLVHQALRNMHYHDMDPRRAISESCRTRLRPIAMTTTTTVFGLLPLVIMPGAGSELYRGLGSVLLGGLLVASLFTLILVPALFSLFVSVKEALHFGKETEHRPVLTDPVTPLATDPSEKQPLMS